MKKAFMEDPFKLEAPLHQVAAYVAIFPGIMCAASFLSSMYGLTTPWLSTAGNVLGIIAVFMIRNCVVNYRRVKELSLGACLRFAFYLTVYAGIITDVAQYVYFRWLDGGRMLQAFENMIDSPEFRQAMQGQPALDWNMLLRMLHQLTLSDIMLEMMLFNLILAVPVGLLAGLFGHWATIRKVN